MYSTLIVLVVAGLLGPLLSDSRRPLVPVVLGELLGGILLGRTGLGWIDATVGAMPAFYGLGFGLLMVTAGQHVDVDSPSFRTGLKTAIRVFLVVALTALPIGVAIATLEGSVSIALITILLIGSSAAIVMPIVDEQRLSGPTITILTGWIGLADGLTVIAMPLALTGADHLVTALLGDLAIVAVAAGLFWVVVRTETRPSVKELVDRSRQRGWALQLRMSLLALAILGAIAEATGGSLLVAGFATGVVLARVAHSDRLALQLAGVANGFFVPAFFVLLGSTIDIRSLLGSPPAIALAVLMGLGSVGVHLIASLIAAPSERLALGLAASAQLGLPAAAAALGLEAGALSPALAAALVTGGCLTLLPAAVGTDLLARHLARPAQVDRS